MGCIGCLLIIVVGLSGVDLQTAHLEWIEGFVTPGNNISLRCSSTSTFLFYMRWFFEGENAAPTEIFNYNYALSQEEAFGNYSWRTDFDVETPSRDIITLIIMDNQMCKDDGSYYCAIESSNNVDSEAIHINVSESVEEHTFPMPSSGETEFNCMAGLGSPPADITWTRNGETVDGYSNRSCYCGYYCSTSGMLFLSNGEKDEEIECTVSQGYPYNLTVSLPPHIIGLYDIQSHGADVCTEVDLIVECQYTYTGFISHWLEKGGHYVAECSVSSRAMLPLGNNISCEMTDDGISYTIKSATSSDSGVYTCHALTDRGGIASQPSIVEVKECPSTPTGAIVGCVIIGCLVCIVIVLAMYYRRIFKTRKPVSQNPIVELDVGRNATLVYHHTLGGLTSIALKKGNDILASIDDIAAGKWENGQVRWDKTDSGHTWTIKDMTTKDTGSYASVACAQVLLVCGKKLTSESTEVSVLEDAKRKEYDKKTSDQLSYRSRSSSKVVPIHDYTFDERDNTARYDAVNPHAIMPTVPIITPDQRRKLPVLSTIIAVSPEYITDADE